MLWHEHSSLDHCMHLIPTDDRSLHLITIENGATISHHYWWLNHYISSLLMAGLLYIAFVDSVLFLRLPICFFFYLSVIFTSNENTEASPDTAKPKFMRNFENIEYISAFLNVNIYLIICCLCGIVTNKSDHGARLQQKQKLCQ